MLERICKKVEEKAKWRVYRIEEMLSVMPSRTYYPQTSGCYSLPLLSSLATLETSFSNSSNAADTLKVGSRRFALITQSYFCISLPNDDLFKRNVSFSNRFALFL